jgi:hypothetical protein
MDFARRFIGNFAQPIGIWGRAVARGFDICNRTANDWTISLLGIKPTGQVLAAGFGSGKTLM